MLVFYTFHSSRIISFDMVEYKNTERLHAPLKAHGEFWRHVLVLVATLLASAVLCAPAAADVPSLKDKRIGISVAGTEHYWDLKAYRDKSMKCSGWAGYLSRWTAAVRIASRSPNFRR